VRPHILPRAAIKRSELMVMILGSRTYRASGVLKEVEMARDEGVPIVQIIGISGSNPTSVPNAGRVYSWNWPNLKKVFGQ